MYYSNSFELTELFLVLLKIVSITVGLKDGNISLILQYQWLVENIPVLCVKWLILRNHNAKNQMFYVMRNQV